MSSEPLRELPPPVPGVPPALDERDAGGGRGPLERVWRALTHNRLSLTGGAILVTLILIALFAPLIAPYPPDRRGIWPRAARPRTPPCIHLLGCPADRPQLLFGSDGNGRDLFSRVIFGSRLSLQIGILTVGGAIVIGGLLGALAGYAGGWLDNVIMRLMDVVLAFPSLLLAIAIVTVLGPSLTNALIAIGIVSIPVYARVMRSSVLAIKEFDYVTAARAIGAQHTHILFRSILPNAMAPLLVTGTLGIAGAILDAAALSFLGLGATRPTPEWGLMLGDERSSVINAPYLLFFPGIAIMITVLSFNLLGDGLRDALDPRLRNQ
jgi:ABC-type dipeptide/oligopeptide/nickel transport system permease subunit